MDTPTIEIKYSCKLCGLHRRKLRVRTRKENEGIVEWFKDVVVMAIAVNHHEVSPACTNRKIEEVMIPIENDKRVGDVVEGECRG